MEAGALSGTKRKPGEAGLPDTSELLGADQERAAPTLLLHPPTPPCQLTTDARAAGFKEVSALVREPRPDMLPGLSARGM